jgi:hypothetical protein
MRDDPSTLSRKAREQLARDVRQMAMTNALTARLLALGYAALRWGMQRFTRHWRWRHLDTTFLSQGDQRSPKPNGASDRPNSPLHVHVARVAPPPHVRLLNDLPS